MNYDYPKSSSGGSGDGCFGLLAMLYLVGAGICYGVYALVMLIVEGWNAFGEFLESRGFSYGQLFLALLLSLVAGYLLYLLFRRIFSEIQIERKRRREQRMYSQSRLYRIETGITKTIAYTDEAKTKLSLVNTKIGKEENFIAQTAQELKRTFSDSEAHRREAAPLEEILSQRRELVEKLRKKAENVREYIHAMEHMLTTLHMKKKVVEHLKDQEDYDAIVAEIDAITIERYHDTMDFQEDAELDLDDAIGEEHERTGGRSSFGYRMKTRERREYSKRFPYSDEEIDTTA